MRKLSLICTLLVGLAIAAGGCTDAGGLADAGTPGLPPGGSTGGTDGGTGGGTGGSTGGGTSGSGPRLIFQADFQSNIYTYGMGGSGANFVFSTNDTDRRDDQLFSYRDTATVELTQLTDVTNASVGVQAIQTFDLDANGTKVAFLYEGDITGDNPNERSQIFMAETDGSGITQVTNNESSSNASLDEPQLSGDGSLLIFRTNGDLTGGNTDRSDHIFSINADGTGLTQLTTGEDVAARSLVLSDDGSTIAYTDDSDPLGNNADGSRELFVMASDGTGLAQITIVDDEDTGLYDLEISDDGSLVVFASRDEIVPGGNPTGSLEVYVAATDGSSLIQVTSAGKLSGSPDISGDGQWMVFVSNANLTGDNEREDTTVFWADTTGSNITQLMRNATMGGEGGFRGGSEPQISDDGAEISFTSSGNYVEGTETNKEKLYVMDRS